MALVAELELVEGSIDVVAGAGVVFLFGCLVVALFDSHRWDLPATFCFRSI